MMAAALARLRSHCTHTDIVVRRLRADARMFEELAGMAQHHAEEATRAAMGPAGPPTPEYTRRQTWEDRPRLLERSAALGEIASALRSTIAAAKRGAS